MNRRGWLIVGGVLLAGLAVAGVTAARTLDIRDTLGLRPSPPLEINACSRAQNIVLPFGTPSRSGRWTALPASPIEQDEPRATAAKGRIYILGGLEMKRPGAPLTSVDTFVSYDPRRQQYTRLPPLPRRVDHAGVASVGGDVYLIGGYSDGHPLDLAFRYAPDSGRWTKLAPMPTPRGFLSATAIGTRIYAVGGVTDRTTYASDHAVEPTTRVEIYDTTSGRWSRGPDLPVSTQHAGAAAAGGELYVIGGRHEGNLALDNVQRFDPATNRWQQLAHLPLGAGGLQAVSVHDRIIAIAGGDDLHWWVTPATWGFDATRNRWQRLADLRVARHGHAAAALGSFAYVFGGSPCPGFGITSTGEKLKVAKSG